MKPLRFVLVGMGARARTWRRVLGDHPDCTIVGFVDSDAERREAAAVELADAIGGDSLTDVLDQTEADVALLCTPPGGRDDQIAAACAAGLAILAEKPLADSVAAAAQHVTTAEAAGVALTVGLNFRYLAVTTALKELIAREDLGPAGFGRFTYERWRDGYLEGLNRYPLTMEHPMLWEQSIHHFDLMRFVYESEPVTVSARTFNPSWSMYDGDANVSALITFENGIEVNYQGTWAGNWRPMGFEWRTECRGGVVVQRDMFGDLGYALRDDDTLTPVELPDVTPWVDDAAALLEDFVAHFRDGTALPCTGIDHLNSLRMVEACILSSSGEGSVRLSELE